MITLGIVLAIKLAAKKALLHVIPTKDIMKIDKQLAFEAGAALISGVATAVVAPAVASALTDTQKPENWYATGSVAVVLGAGIMVTGALMGKNTMAIAAGAAMVGVGASFAYLSYEAKSAQEARKKAKDDLTAADVVAAAAAASKNMVKGFVGLEQIDGAHHRSVIPGQVNTGLSQSVAAPHGFGPLMPSTAQGMSGRRYVRAFDTILGGGR